MINKNIIFCLEYFLLIFLVGCTAFKNVPGEEYQYEQLSETPGIDAYQAIETICSPEDAALMEEDFYEEAKLWRYAAQKEVFVCRGKEKIEANIVLKERGDLLPKSELKEAITYLRNEWNAVVDIFNYGDTYLDNNIVERMNRYISLSRKNSLFFGSHKGAERGAILYTIALTCRMNKVNLFEYLTDVINRTAEWQPNTPLEKYRQLLPDRWEKAND